MLPFDRREQVERADGRTDRCLRDMCVNGGSLEAVVSQQELDGSDVGAGLQKMRSKTVTKGMRSNRLGDAGVTSGTDTGMLES